MKSWDIQVILAAVKCKKEKVKWNNTMSISTYNLHQAVVSLAMSRCGLLFTYMHSKNLRHSEFCPADLAEYREKITLQMPLLTTITAVSNSLWNYLWYIRSVGFFIRNLRWNKLQTKFKRNLAVRCIYIDLSCPYIHPDKHQSIRKIAACEKLAGAYLQK